MRKRRTLCHAPHPKMTLKSAAPCVKATSHSSTARPQEKAFPHGEEARLRRLEPSGYLILRDAALCAAPQDEEKPEMGEKTINARYGPSSSPRAARGWPRPDGSPSRSRRACRRRPRG